MRLGQALTILAFFLGLAAVLPAQRPEIKSTAEVLFGSTANCTQVATIDYAKVAMATVEYQTIKSEGIQKGSARYDLLAAEMQKRIKEACKAAAQASGCDCVVRSSDVSTEKGGKVVDLTDDVIGKLGS
jgi:hypothetical protein